MNEEQVRKIIREEIINILGSSSRIPLPIDQAFRSRFIQTSTTSIAVSGKSGSSENQGVNEGGAATYSVLGPPDNFLAVTVGGVVIGNVPNYL